ncbi:MAG: ABC transporter ATP-binding protein [Lachnospiraceae bacterium]|nr:ABC transporter ATP-binding protein [Lachnospiraceae bacterium]
MIKVKIENLFKGYGKTKVLEGVSFEVRKGSIHGLIGPNGSGKTTLIKCLTGIYQPDQGSICLDEEEIYDNPAAKMKMGYVADSNDYYPNYRIKEMVKIYEAAYPTFSKEDFDYYNEAMGLNVKKMIKQLSKGQKMRLALILNLAIHPDILILDEPMEGIDVIAKQQLFDMIINEVEEREMTVLITSHHLEEIENFCDSITMIHEGKLTGTGSLDEVKEKATKLQIVFPEGLPEGFAGWKGVLNFSNIGSIYTVIWEDFDEEKKELLYECGAAFVEEIPISLEEIFLYMNKEGREQ